MPQNIIKCLTASYWNRQETTHLLPSMIQGFVFNYMGVIASSGLFAVHRQHILKGFQCVGLLISLRAVIQNTNYIPGENQQDYMEQTEL